MKISGFDNTEDLRLVIAYIMWLSLLSMPQPKSIRNLMNTVRYK